MTPRLGGQAVIRVHLWGGEDLTAVLADGSAADLAGMAVDRFPGLEHMEISTSERPLVADVTAVPDTSDIDVVFLSLAPDVFVDDEASRPGFLELMTAHVRALKEGDVHVVVLNASTIDPTEIVSNYRGRPEPFTRRAQRLNLASMQLSIDEGISIVDADRLIAELGGANTVEAPLRYNAEARAVLRDEALRVLDDYGFFEVRPLVEQVGRERS